jgi:hypothetical protein
MARFIISAFAAAILLAAATGVLSSHSVWSNGAAGRGGMPSLQELQGPSRTERLPLQDFEDRSLEFPRETKQN